MLRCACWTSVCTKLCRRGQDVEHHRRARCDGSSAPCSGGPQISPHSCAAGAEPEAERSLPSDDFSTVESESVAPAYRCKGPYIDTRRASTAARASTPPWEPAPPEQRSVEPRRQVASSTRRPFPGADLAALQTLIGKQVPAIATPRPSCGSSLSYAPTHCQAHSSRFARRVADQTAGAEELTFPPNPARWRDARSNYRRPPRCRRGGTRGQW